MSSSDPFTLVRNRMAKLGLFEKDLIERFIRASGHGGQKVNKTSSCVQLSHPGLGLEVKVQDSRSRDSNRLSAREHLCQIVEDRKRTQLAARKERRERIRRQKRRPSPAARRRNVANKRRHGEKKQNRKKPTSD